MLSEKTMARSRQACRLAALLHDTGHCCFSHAAESVIHKDGKHESLTVELLRAPGELKSIIDELFFPGCAELTANLIKPSKTDTPQTKLLRDIVSGQIDADRTDYLLRDSHHCGVDYGKFDHRRLIECLTVWKDEDTGQLEMAIKRDGIHSFESLILARYQMNTQVYYHRLRRIYDYYLKEFFRSLDKKEFGDTGKILWWNDVRAMDRLLDAADDNEQPGHKWANRIIHRRHHRDVYALEEGDGALALRQVQRVLLEIKAEFPQVDFIADLPPEPQAIHKLALDDDQSDADLIDFPVLEGGRRSSLGGRSHILRRLPRQFRVGFIFADVTDKATRDKIRTRCREIRHRQ